MGGERASTSRRRLAGLICCNCKSSLPPGPARERYCDRCDPRRRVYMQFVKTGGAWRVTFLEENLRKALPRALSFQDAGKIHELARKGGAEANLAGFQGLEEGIRLGRGGVWLRLSTAQYDVLRQ